MDERYWIPGKINQFDKDSKNNNTVVTLKLITLKFVPEERRIQRWKLVNSCNWFIDNTGKSVFLVNS